MFAGTGAVKADGTADVVTIPTSPTADSGYGTTAKMTLKIRGVNEGTFKLQLECAFVHASDLQRHFGRCTVAAVSSWARWDGHYISSSISLDCASSSEHVPPLYPVFSNGGTAIIKRRLERQRECRVARDAQLRFCGRCGLDCLWRHGERTLDTARLRRSEISSA